MKEMMVLVALVLAGACNQAPAAEPQPGAAQPGAKNYKIAVDAPAQAKLGQKSQFKIVITPGTGYHINQEFPFEMQLAAADVKLGKSQLGKKDARTFSENEARFEVEFVPEKAGQREFTAKVKFAICTDKDCWPKRETVSWKTNAGN